MYRTGYSSSWLIATIIVFSSTTKAHVNEFLHQDSKQLENLALAVSKVVDKDFTTGVKTMNLILPEHSVNSKLKDFSENLLSKSFPSLKAVYRQESSTKLTTIVGRRKRYVIIAIEHFEHFSEIYSKMLPRYFRFSGLYLIVLLQGAFVEIQEIFGLLWKLQIYNANVMFADELGTVFVQTFMPFKSFNCSDTSPKLLDKFVGGKFLKGTRNFFPEKMKNLSNCPVRISVSNTTEPFVITRYSEHSGYNISGLDVSLIDTLSASMNFKVNYSFIGDVGHLLENGTGIGPLKALMDDKADISVSGWLVKASRAKFFDSSSTYTSGEIKFLVPPVGDLTALEKLIFPFSPSSWIMISSCFLIGMLLIFTVKRKANELQNFVFGKGVKSPFFNLYIAFIGGNQKILPRRNFARYLLMMFLMYSLVIRTLYQGSYYQLMQSSKQFDEIETIDEMIRKNFKFFVPEGIADLFQGNEEMTKRFKFDQV